jgi:hypothetical protein
MALVEPELFIKIFCVVMGMYGLQMLAVPAKMVTDHFDAPATPLLQFWIRGSSCAFLTIVYLVKFKLATEDAVPVALAMSVACGALYPWNAKFGYLSPGLPTKYPMHYVPEVLMAVLARCPLTLDLASMASRRDATLPHAIATTRSHRAGPHGPRHRGHDVSDHPLPHHPVITYSSTRGRLFART